jgi:peptide deformylase
MIITDQNILTKENKEIHPNEWDRIFKKLIKALPEEGIGLAAPQIGINKKAFIMRINNEIIKFANPGLTGFWKSFQAIESCLSIPGKKFKVTRFKSINVIDEINGRQKLEDELAQVFQHEHDHTLGITLLQSGDEIRNE